MSNDEATYQENELNYKEKQEVQQIIKELFRFVNKFDVPMEEFAQQVIYQHRTLQQNLMRLMIEVIDKWSQQENYDLSNEKTIKLSKKIMEAIKEDHYLPRV